ncbi:MAG: beta-lactamase family protein [bacterium]|nr:MAG: beta-lactamase family protein [bacterium]
MNNRWMFLLLFCFTFFSFSFGQNFSIEDHPEVAANLQIIKTWIESQIEYNNLPGLSVGIIYDQNLIWQKGFGYADVEKKIPMTPQTIFRIASITKLFTCTAIMQLRDQGKLQLDDPVEKHLPWFKIKNRFPDAPTITIRHLMTHTSGLPREAAFPYWTDHQFPTLNQIMETLPNQETIYPAETKLKYSNLGMALLGHILVAVSGKDYESYIQNHILKPLAMTSTTIYLTDEQRKRMATGYGRRLADGMRKPMEISDYKGISPAASISSNVEDLAKFASLQFSDENSRDKQILKGSTLREMQRVHWLQPSWKSGRGLGFSVWYRDEKTFVGHSGWVAGYRTQLLLCPEHKIAVIIMSNAEDGLPGFFANKIFDVVAPSIKKAIEPPAKVSQLNPGWKKYVGKYSDPFDWEYEVMILNNELVLYGFSYPPDENPKAGIIELTPEGGHTFRMTGENGNGELLTFEMDSDGKVKRVKMGENFIFPSVKNSQYQKTKSN